MKPKVKFESKDDKLFINDQEVIKGYESSSGWYWFVTEITDTQTTVFPNGIEFITNQNYFGFVQGIEEEWGYFSLNELESFPEIVWKIKQNDLPYAGRRNEDEEVVLNSENTFAQESETRMKF